MLAPIVSTIPPLCHRADPRDESSAGLSWWLCHAHSRSEKRVAAEFLAADVPHFLPLRQIERVKPNRCRVAFDVPIFGGYLFVAGDEFDRLNASASRCVVHLIPVFDVPGLLADLGQLMDAIESGAPIGEARKPQPGSTVRVTSGPLADQVGTLVREAHGDYLLIHVRMLGQVVPVEVEQWRAEVIDPDPPR